jgi:ferritin-like metal-binding protein YciE
MSTADELIIEELRHAHATEQSSLSLLQGHLRGAPPGPYRSLVRRHLDETRRHASQIEDRLTDKGASEGLLQIGLTLVEGVAGRVIGLALGPVNLLASRTRPEAMLRNTLDVIAAEARESATYDALERLASRAGDEVTASVARTIRADEERALEAFQGLIPGLTERIARERLGVGAAQSRQPASGSDEPAPRRGRREAPAPPEPAVGPVGEPPIGRVAPGTRRGHQEPTTRGAEGANNGGPVPSSEEPTRGQVARLREELREREGQDADVSVGTASPGPELRVDAPWEGYDEMTAAQVVARLRSADDTVAAVVRLYEQANKGRKSVLQATEQRT